jgi:hypothetical protein
MLPRLIAFGPCLPGEAKTSLEIHVLAEVVRVDNVGLLGSSPAALLATEHRPIDLFELQKTAPDVGGVIGE